MDIDEQLHAWFAKPGPEHLAQFYPYESALIAGLTEYFVAGLRANETCIAIATPQHLDRLRAGLKANGIDLKRARAEGTFGEYDARGMLATFMGGNLPDRAKFMDTAGSLLEAAERRGQPVRLFGEMVALLWQEHKQSAVLQLEKLWNELISGKSVSLYCAYPMLQFDSYIHGDAIANIRRLHAHNTPAYAQRAVLQQG